MGRPRTLDRILTARQREVLEGIARGQTNPEIAADLGISFETVKMHVAHIFTTLDVTSREEAAGIWNSGALAETPPRRSLFSSPLMKLAGGFAGLAVAAGIAALVLISLNGEDEPGDGTPTDTMSPSPVAADINTPLPMRTINVEWEYAADETRHAPVAADEHGVIASLWVPTDPGEGTGRVVSLDGDSGAEQWKVDLPCVPFTAALDAERAYVPCNDGAVYALARDDGRTLWRTETRTSPLAPVIGEGLLFLDSADPDGPSQLGVDPKYYGVADVIALDLATGQERWRVAMGGEDVFVSYAEGTVFAVNGRNSSAGAPLRLAALNARDGQERWTVPVDGSRHAPRIDGGDVFVSSDVVASFNGATGALNWSYDRFAHDIAVTRGSVFGVGSYGNDASFGLDAVTGDVLWTEGYCDCAFHPVQAGDVVFFGGAFGAIDPRFGSPAITSDDEIGSILAPAIVGEWIYTGDVRHSGSYRTVVQGIR